MAKLLSIGEKDIKAAYDVGGVSDADMKEFEADCFVEGSEPSYSSQPAPGAAVAISAKGV